MKKIAFLITTFLFSFFSLFVSAQSATNEVDMADAMHANGKIYVVVAVLSVVFIGLLIFLISIDRKVSRLEKEMNKGK